MKYAKGTLVAQLTSVRQAWVRSIEGEHAEQQKTYQKALKRWQDTGKAEIVEHLQKALRDVKADRPVDLYRLWNKVDTAPAPPKEPGEVECHAKVKAIDTALAVLETVADDEITAHSLNQAGIKDVNALLRRPC